MNYTKENNTLIPGEGSPELKARQNNKILMSKINNLENRVLILENQLSELLTIFQLKTQ